MHKKRIILFALLLAKPLAADWGSIGSQIASAGESIGGFVEQMGVGMAGVVPAGYDYSFQVFNGANVGMYVDIHKAISVMGARFNKGGGDSQTLQPGQNSGTTFSKEHLYFEIEISGGGSDYKDPHYTLGAQNDPTIYYYHCYNDSSSGSPATELLGGGYTSTTTGWSGRIENKLTTVSSVKYTITGPQSSGGQPDVRSLTISDIDPESFNYVTLPQGFTIRPSTLVCSASPVIIPQEGIAQVTDTTTKASTAVCMNYVINSAGGFETGIAPGNFEQPASVTQLRDISPTQCQIYNQAAAQAAPIGQLAPLDIPWQSVWAVYEGTGWSQAQQQVMATPMWQIPSGENALCMLVRPSLARMAQNGPARLFVVRMNIPEKPSPTDIQKAQQFLSKLVHGQLYVSALATSAQGGGTLITQANANSLSLPTGWYATGQATFSPTGPFVAYPPLSSTYLGSSLTPSALTVQKKAQLLGLVLPEDVGILEDPSTGVKGYIMTTDVFTPYGSGSGPFYYLVSPCYVDMGQLLGTLMNYASVCNYQGLTADAYNQLVQSFLPNTVGEWITGYTRNPLDVEESIASFLLLLGQGDMTQLTTAFTSDKSFYVDSRAKKKLSPQGLALLNMLLYGPCSISQLPTYYKAGSSYMSGQSGWPTVSVNL